MEKSLQRAKEDILLVMATIKNYTCITTMINKTSLQDVSVKKSGSVGDIKSVADHTYSIREKYAKKHYRVAGNQ